MDLITDIIKVATATVAFLIILYFWWWCVKLACGDLAQYWHETLRKIDTKHDHKQGGEDD